jgi:hypothetical protein
MKMTLSTSQVASELQADQNANWSYAGSRALAEYLEALEEDTGEEIEFDRVAIRCDFSEYRRFQDWADDYGHEYDKEANEDEQAEEIREYILDRGQLIEFEGGVIVSSF